jgi:hypothetical protein
MEILNESLELLCEDLGGGEWEVEYSVCPLLLSSSILLCTQISVIKEEES